MALPHLWKLPVPPLQRCFERIIPKRDDAFLLFACESALPGPHPGRRHGRLHGRYYQQEMTLA